MELRFFEKYIDKQYEDGKIDTKDANSKGDVQVCCPFSHSKEVIDDAWNKTVVDYYEEIPSAGINLDKRLFNCFVCHKGMKELEFAMAITNKSSDEIIKEYVAKKELSSVVDEWEQLQHKELLNNAEVMNKLYELNINDDVIQELKLGLVTNKLATPVFKDGEMINMARYNILKLPNTPKNMYNANANSGDIIPFDIWKKDTKTTVLCEGEKDMLVARSFGFNAITLTGGAGASLQREYLKYFNGRTVYIVYDNDDAGKHGAEMMYKDLTEAGANVFITDIGAVCVETKEDVADFFNKYGKNRQDFIELLEKHSSKLSEDRVKEVSTKYNIKTTKLEDNIKNSKMHTHLKSTFQIIATGDNNYGVPEYALFTQDEGGEAASWYLKDNHHNFLELIEKGTSSEIPNTLAQLCGLPKNWMKEYKLEKGKLKSVYKYVVADEMKTTDEKANEKTIDLYTFEPLTIGSTYEIDYKIYPHPNEGQRLIAVALSVKQTDFSFDINNKELTDSLDVFKVETTIENKVKDLYNSARAHIAPYLHFDMWLLYDLVFNSPLDITYGNRMRGALDVFCIGDTRTGKSETSKALIGLYDFGEDINLKTSTIQSLIGGTDEKRKTTKLGVLPRHHKELIVMEELSGAPEGFVKTLTEIRSSSMVKVYRVAGDLKAPCKLRMITISNPISDEDVSSLSSYPYAVKPIMELIKAPEDIARYDAFIAVPRVEKLTNVFENKVDNSLKIDAKHYKNKIRWVRALTADNIIISNELGSYTFNRAQELNKLFECSFALFGSETDKKIIRLASALAVMLASTENYKDVIVTKEHVDYIFDFMIRLYDNKTFRLKDFADEEKAYKEVDEKDTRALNDSYPKNATVIDFLANNSKVTRNELQTISGLSRDDFARIFNFLASRKFIQLSNDRVTPTLKFRRTYELINKDFNLYDQENTQESANIF